MKSTGKTTRRDFCKGLCAASLMPATLQSFAKFYCGMDFSKGGPQTTVYLRGGRGHGWSLSQYWRRELGQISPKELVGGRADPKPMSLYSRPSTRKLQAKDKSKEDKLKERN